MKRTFAIVMIAAMAVLGLWGCGQGEETADSTAVDPSDEVATVSLADTSSPDEASDDATASPEAEDEPAATDDKTRSVISILGDADFTAANGVVGGSGTEDDPYVIAGWEIMVPSDAAYGVRIENVTASFILRGVMVQNARQSDGAGIRIGFAQSGVLEGCSVSNSVNGIDIISSTDITMEDCVLYTSGGGLQVVGESEEQYRHQISETNLYNDRPIYYYYGLDGETISGLKTGHLSVAGSRNVTISNNEVVNGDGLTLAFVDDSAVSQNVAHRLENVRNEHGITLYISNNNDVYENIVKNNRLAGIQLTLANGNRIYSNQSYANDTGIRLLASDGNEVTSNDVFATITGVDLLGGAADNVIAENTIRDDGEHTIYAVLLEAALGNTIERNLIFGSQMGVALEAQASGNTVEENSVIACGYGLYISGSNNVFERNLLTQHSRAILFPETFEETTTRANTFRGNVFADSGNQVYTNMDSTGNRFTENVFLNEGRDLINDQGEGNLWSVDGVGNFYGFGSVEDADGDGVGDEPMDIYPSGAQDPAPMATIDVDDLGYGILGTLEHSTTVLTNDDGDRIEVDTFLAKTPIERATGFRGFPTELIEGFPGILFTFSEEKEASFVMLTVPFDLDIAFFNADGELVGSTTMEALSTTRYTASAPYQYALELPSGSLESLGIGEDSTLVLP